MEQELFQDIKKYLGDDYDPERASSVRFCIRRAITSFKNKRNYPSSYTDKAIEADMKRYYPCLFDLALYWCNMQGIEFETSHSESGTTASWMSESDIYALHRVLSISVIC